jgi:EAL domain-containing protein (putative c-di-GMP-specific phosphodiesterase class I)
MGIYSSGRIGEWILWEACSQINKWDESGIHIQHMSVNITPRQFKHPYFLEMVIDVLEVTRLEPNRLYLEITEGMLLDNDPGTYDILRRLHDFGIHLSVDDFGTGYSSLSYIKRYPIDLIKIDRSFIQDIPDDANDIAIVKAIIDLSASLHIEVLAEGAEELKQIQCLQELGCHLVQGYFFSSPLSAEPFITSYDNILTKANGVKTYS